MKSSDGFRREGSVPFKAAWYYKFSGDELWRGDFGPHRGSGVSPLWHL